MIQDVIYYLKSMFEKGYAVFSIWFTIFSQLFGKYIFNDADFFRFLFVLICLDTFFAVVKTIKFGGLRSLSFTAAQGFVLKIVLYFGALALMHNVVNFTIHGKPNGYFTWIESVVYSYLMCKEALSVARNINGISPAMVPTFLIDKLNNFIKTGRFSDLANDDNKPQQNQ